MVRNNTVTIISNNDEKKKIIKEEEWESITNLVSTRLVQDMHTFIAPTENQHVDRTRIANLSIIFNGKLYESIAFDEGSPPEELQPLITHILALTETVE